MFVYTSSRGKSNRSFSKSEFQMFSLISGRRCWCPSEGHQYGVCILSSINLPETFRQITVYRTGLQLGEFVYLLIFCNIWNS